MTTPPFLIMPGLTRSTVSPDINDSPKKSIVNSPSLRETSPSIRSLKDMRSSRNEQKVQKIREKSPEQVHALEVFMGKVSALENKWKIQKQENSPANLANSFNIKLTNTVEGQEQCFRHPATPSRTPAHHFMTYDGRSSTVSLSSQDRAIYEPLTAPKTVNTEAKERGLFSFIDEAEESEDGLNAYATSKIKKPANFVSHKKNTGQFAITEKSLSPTKSPSAKNIHVSPKTPAKTPSGQTKNIGQLKPAVINLKKGVIEENGTETISLKNNLKKSFVVDYSSDAEKEKINIKPKSIVANLKFSSEENRQESNEKSKNARVRPTPPSSTDDSSHSRSDISTRAITPHVEIAQAFKEKETSCDKNYVSPVKGLTVVKTAKKDLKIEEKRENNFVPSAVDAVKSVKGTGNQPILKEISKEQFVKKEESNKEIKEQTPNIKEKEAILTVASPNRKSKTPTKVAPPSKINAFSKKNYPQVPDANYMAKLALNHGTYGLVDNKKEFHPVISERDKLHAEILTKLAKERLIK